MKKELKMVLLTLMGSTMAITSCSQDETVESLAVKPEGRQEIEFHLDMMSRATDRTITNLDTIWVYADDGKETVFEATAFIKDQYGNFKPEEKMYWPEGKDNLNFTAFWPSPDVLNHDPNHTGENHAKLSLSPGNVTLDSEIAWNTAYHYDLITAVATINRDVANGGIPLAFKHAFAQVEFRAKIGESAEHRVDIYGIQLRVSNTKGVYSLTQDLWTLLSSQQYFKSAPNGVLTVSDTPRSLTEKTGPMYLLPATWQFVQYFTGAKENSNGVFLMVFGKAYDEEGVQIYPKAEDMGDNNRVPSDSYIEGMSAYQDITNTGIMRIQLGGLEDFKVESGNKYVFTIDFTNGIGNFSHKDKDKPSQPIINNSLTTKVSVESWKMYDDINVDSNQ
ncbi:MAG: fimbrillin family protein [Muribaculaceae bacterium]|nr:fimbrillin family protein [Muribaculaceae bacterium]